MFVGIRTDDAYDFIVEVGLGLLNRADRLSFLIPMVLVPFDLLGLQLLQVPGASFDAFQQLFAAFRRDELVKGGRLALAFDVAQKQCVHLN